VQAVSSLPSVEKVALSTTAPFEKAVIFNTHVRVAGSLQDFVVIPMRISPEYPLLYKMRVLAGRLLSRQRALDRFSGNGNAANEGHNILINESAARLFGFDTGHTAGRSLILADGSRVNIVGILGDAQVDGAAKSVAPMIYYDDPNAANAVSVKMRDGQTLAAVKSINKVWKAMAPESAMQMRFLNRDFQIQFRDLERRGLIFGIFVAVVIAVASLGLFGVAAFSVDRRTKEIGVRKVFGAKAADIVRMLMRQFSAPVLIASLIAWPLAYLYLNHWLEQYPHRVSLDPIYFIATTLIALLISSATVFVHAWRAAKSHPIHALRYE
jgi:putative ABC transport system permease protein